MNIWFKILIKLVDALDAVDEAIKSETFLIQTLLNFN